MKGEETQTEYAFSLGNQRPFGWCTGRLLLGVGWAWVKVRVAVKVRLPAHVGAGTGPL